LAFALVRAAGRARGGCFQNRIEVAALRAAIADVSAKSY
jgi:hypothetical protein